MKDVFEGSGPHKLVAGGIWFILLMTICGMLWWVWSILVSRYYGAIGYGIFNTAQSIFNFAWAFIFGGLFSGLIKHGSEYISKSSWKITRYFSMALKYMTILGVGVFMIMLLFASTIDDMILWIMAVSIAISFLFSGTKDALASIIGSFQKNNYLSFIDSSRSIIILLGGIVFILIGFPSYSLPVLLIFGTVWQLWITLHFLKSRLKRTLPFNLDSLFKDAKTSMFSDIKDFSKIAVFGFFVSLGMISFNVMKSLDIVVMNIFFSYGEIGIYSISDTISSILFYMTSFSIPIIPAIAEAYSTRDKKVLSRYVKVALKYPLIIGIPLMLVILTMAEPIVVGIYGSEFYGAIAPLQVLIIGTFMLMLGYNMSSILIGIGKPKLSGTLMVIAATQYISSLFFFIPAMGFMGAAFALMFTGFTSILLIPYFLRKELKVPIYGGLQKVLLASAVMFIILYLVPKTNTSFIVVGIIVSSLVFGVMLRKMNYITSDDTKMIRSTFRGFRTSRRRNPLKS